MATRGKLALWSVLAVMFTLTILVYISPSKPSSRTVLQIQQDLPPSLQESTNSVRSDVIVHKHINIDAPKISDGSLKPPKAMKGYESSAAFMKAQTAIQNQRKDIVERVCKKYHPNPARDIVKDPPWNILVDDKYKLMYCFVQKVACTNWKKVFLVLSGQYNTTQSIPQYFTNRKGVKMLKSLKDYSEDDRRRILSDYTKFMFARHPFSRVLSAYRNKLAPESTFARAVKWQRKVGQRIINKFRPGAVKVTKENFSQNAYDLTFDEFIHYVFSPRAGKSGNKHWRDLHVSCLPCLINYDVIGKIETIEDDARYILTRSGASDVVRFPSSEGSSPTNSSDPYLIDKYFADVPTKDIMDLYNRYKLDFLLFDYHASVENVLGVRR